MGADFYAILGVNRSATVEDIKKAYRQLAIKYHPDRNKGDKASEEKFKEINRAYETLVDPEKRKIYDQFGEEGLKGDAFAGGGQGYGFGEGGFGDFTDIFSELFGGGGGGRTRRSASRAAQSPRQGSDILVNVKISFRDAFFGTQKDIYVVRSSVCSHCHGTGAEAGTSKKTCPTCGGSGQVRMSQGFFSVAQPCPTCHGAGTVVEKPCKYCQGTGFIREEKVITVTIPAGISTGKKIRVAGEGNAGYNGGPRGDVYLAVTVEPSDLFTRQGDDIFMQLPVTYPQLVLGDAVEVPTMTGKVEMKIPAGSQPGTKLRLKGKGFPSLSHRVTGDQYVVLHLEVPKNISSGHRQAVEDLKQYDNETKQRPFFSQFLGKMKNLFGMIFS